jgi:large repetitive protein
MRPSILEILEPRRLFNGLPAASVSDVSVSEGNAGNQHAAVVVSLSARSNKTVTVNYATANGTAMAGSDYTAASGKLTFAPGETRKSILVPVTGDRQIESDESFVVNLSPDRNARIARGQATVTILDDEPRISIADAWNYWDPTFTFTVRLSAPSDEVVTVDFETYDGSAWAGIDYVATSGTLTFAPGVTSATITVEAITLTSTTEKLFYVRLSGASANAAVLHEWAYGYWYYDYGYYDDSSTGWGEYP